jgi:hypothetical protein
MFKRIIYITVFFVFFCNTYSCSSNNDSTSASEEAAGLSDKMVVRKAGEDLFISAKMDKTTDIVYWFKKCMFNKLYTFYRVSIISNQFDQPNDVFDKAAGTTLNSTFSDNIGPFCISGHGWCGGNHPYVDGKTLTAYNLSYSIIVNGKEFTEDTSVTSNDVEIKVVNAIMNPAKPQVIDNVTTLKDTLCTEYVDYHIYNNNIQVSVKHKFMNDEAVDIERYYGMQSMFAGETHTLTANGKYTQWTPQSEVSTFLKKDYPLFRRFIEKNNIAYQSAYLFNTGLGRHNEVSDDDFIFIGNSNGKTYHKLIGSRKHVKGDEQEWSGVYTWFVTPIVDNEGLFCYEGIIDKKNVIFLDCKKALKINLVLPEKYKKKTLYMLENNPYVEVTRGKAKSSDINIVATKPASCVISFR